MATTHPGTVKAPHSPSDEHLSPNLFREHLSLDDSNGHPTPDLLGSCDLSEEHPEPNLSRSIDELLCDFENHQKQQLRILRAVTNEAINTSEHAAVEPIPPTNAQRTIRVSVEIREMIRDWNKRESPWRETPGIFGALLDAIFNDREIEELATSIQLRMENMPDAPVDPNNFFPRLRTRIRDHVPTSFAHLLKENDIWKIIQYRLDDFGWATPQNDGELIYDSTENGLTCARVIYDFHEYRDFSIHQILQIAYRFAHFSTRPRDQGELASHVMKFVLSYAMEWKVFKWRNLCTDYFSTLQFNFRFFEMPLDRQKSDIERIKKQDKCLVQSDLLREIGYIPRPRKTGSAIAERRVSVLMAYGRCMDTPCWTIFNISGLNTLNARDKSTGETRQYFLDGLSHFRAWYSLLDMELQNCLLAWQKLLSEIDVGTGLRIEELCNPHTLSDLMGDGNDLKRSEFYFVSFSMLRRFADFIEETIRDLEHCCQEVNGRLGENDTSPEGKEKIQEISRQFLETHRGHFQGLMHHIQRKTDTIMLLQQNLLNSTSIRDTPEATHHGRYIFIFMMITIIYLPFVFVTSLFCMNNISEDLPLAASMALFAVTFSLVVSVTYIIASGSFPFANKTELHPILGLIWKSFKYLLETKTKDKQQPERAHSTLDYDSDNNPDAPSASCKSRALERLLSFFKPRRFQPAEVSRDVENRSNTAATVSAATQIEENATPATTRPKLSSTDSNGEVLMRSRSSPI